jgi:hypothetical protein
VVKRRQLRRVGHLKQKGEEIKTEITQDVYQESIKIYL